MKLDHYTGRGVKGFSTEGTGGKIELDGDVTISYFDNVDVRRSLSGTTLLKVEPTGEYQRMIFGHSTPKGPIYVEEIPVSSYTIDDPSNASAIRDAAEAALPPDPSADRVVDGPEEAPETPVEAAETPAEAPKRRRKVRDAPQA